MEEEDPSQCHALESSLWELQVCRGIQRNKNMIHRDEHSQTHCALHSPLLSVDPAEALPP
jgi:hypothetical protein